MSNNKKQLGQFFTKNSEYILSNFAKYIKNKEIVDPFAGGSDLIKWAKDNKVKKIKGYDVDKKYVDSKTIFLNDSINNPLKYNFVLTNPPYLNINKANKEIKKKYFYNFDFEDLYQISLSSIMNSEEGIVIVPINFLSAQNSIKIRNNFFSKFKIIEMNYFKHQVFADTTYNVVAFYYKKKKNIYENNFNIKVHIYPENKIVNLKLSKDFNWSIGGSFLNNIKKEKNILGIKRLTEKDLKNIKGEIEIDIAYNHINNKSKIKISKKLQEKIKSNILLLKAIDSGTEKGRISLENIKEYGVECLISKETSRHMIYLIFEKNLSVKEQKMIIKYFNSEINQLRENYLSLFLTNYRDNDRKRISFNFAYKFINYLYNNKINCSPKRQRQLV